jgi:hypothetical protein
MRQPCFLVLSICILVALAPPTGAADPAAAPLRRGDVFPPFFGQTLTGKNVSFPLPYDGRPTVLVFSFSRTAAADARKWNEHLSENFAGKVPVYGVILLEGAPKLFRGMAIAGIKISMPKSVQDRTIVLYQQEDVWKERLGVSDNSRAYAVVSGPRGHVCWMNSGRFTTAQLMELEREVSAHSGGSGSRRGGFALRARMVKFVFARGYEPDAATHSFQLRKRGPSNVRPFQMGHYQAQKGRSRRETRQDFHAPD